MSISARLDSINSGLTTGLRDYQISIIIGAITLLMLVALYMLISSPVLYQNSVSYMENVITSNTILIFLYAAPIVVCIVHLLFGTERNAKNSIPKGVALSGGLGTPFLLMTRVGSDLWLSSAPQYFIGFTTGQLILIGVLAAVFFVEQVGECINFAREAMRLS